jgi:tape measure domain-containing protein
MPEVASIKAVITLEKSAFDRALESADRRLSQFARQMVTAGNFVDQMGQRMSNFGGVLNRTVTLPLIAAGAAVVAFGKKVVDSAIAMDSLEKGLTAITGSADGAAREIANLRRMASDGPGLDFASAAKGTLTLRAMRISAEDTAGVLETLAKANALAAGSTENYSSALVQLNQMISSGKVQGDEVRIIREQIATFGLFLKDTFNATTEEISKAINDGKISMQDFTTAFIAWGNTLKPPSNTLTNLIVRMRNEVNLALADMGKDFIPDLVKLIPELMKAFRDALPAIKELFRALADVGVPVFRQFIQVSTDLLKWFSGLAPATQQFIIKAAGISMLAGPLLTVAGGFLQLFAGILKVTGLGAALAAFTTRGIGALKALGAAAIAAGAAFTTAAAAAVAALAIWLWKMNEIRESEALQKELENSSRSFGDWITRVREAGGSIQDLQAVTQAYQQAVKDGLFLDDYQSLLAISKQLNNQFKQLDSNVRVNAFGKLIQGAFSVSPIGGDFAGEFAEIQARMQKAVAGTSKEATAAKKAYEALMEDYRGSLDDLERQIFLLTKTGESNRTLWEIEKGRFKALSESQKGRLLDLSIELDKLTSIKTMQDAIDQDSVDRTMATRMNQFGIITDLELAEQKVSSIVSAIKKLMEQGFAEGDDVFARNMEGINKLLQDLKSANIQVDAIKRIEAFKQKLAELAPAITQAVLGVIAYNNALAHTTRRVLDNFSAENAHAMALKAVQFGLSAAMKGVEAYMKRQETFNEYLKDLNLELLRLTKGEEAATKAALMMNDALTSDQADIIMGLQRQISELEKMKQFAEDIANGITDAFMNGLERVRTEGFGAFFRAFEEMLFDMAMAVLKAQVFQMLNSFFQNVFGGGGLGGLFGGGGGLGQTLTQIAGGAIGNGSSGGGGQSQTGWMQMAPAGAPTIVFNIQTNDPGAFKEAMPSLIETAFTEGYNQRRRNRGRI